MDLRLIRSAGVTALAGLALVGCSDDTRHRADRGRQQVAETRLVGLGRASPLIGIADNRPETLSAPRFQATGIKRVRVVVAYDDVGAGGPRRAVQDAYFASARAAGVQPLVSFYRSYAEPAALPTLAQYTAGVRAFRRRFPWVHAYSVWSEPNSVVQPTSRNPERTAAFYRILRRQCRGRCTVVAGDYRLDAGLKSRRWLARYLRAVGRGPHLWGLSAFEDIGSGSAALTGGFLRATRGPVWVNEAGAARPRGAGADEAQRRRMAFLVDRYARVSRRVRRIYVYDWRAAPGALAFDSSLLAPDGTPRPAYRELNRGIGRLTPER